MKILQQSLLLILLTFFQITNAQKVISLFDGSDLNSWYAWGQNSGKHNEASELFRVEDGIIRLYGNEVGYLMTKQSFGEFRLSADFRWNCDDSFVRKSNSVNSGLMYLIPNDAEDMIWPMGFQFQIKKGATGDFIFLHQVTMELGGERTTPGNSEVFGRMKDATHPIGEWNTIEIIYKNGKIIQKLNGKLVNKGKNPSITNGRILLMYEGYPIDFRNVSIKEL